MNAFRKKSPAFVEPSGGSYVAVSSLPKEAVNGDSVIKYVERVEVDPSDRSKVINLPSRDNYSLARMLALGQLPQAVKVSGLVESDTQPDVLGNFEHLRDLEASKKTEPTTTTEPTKE